MKALTNLKCVALMILFLSRFHSLIPVAVLEDPRCIKESMGNNTINGSNNVNSSDWINDCFELMGDPSTHKELLDFYGCDNLTEYKKTEFLCVYQAIDNNSLTTEGCMVHPFRIFKSTILQYDCSNKTALESLANHFDLIELYYIIMQQTLAPKPTTTTELPTIQNIYEKLNRSDEILNTDSVNSISSTLEHSLDNHAENKNPNIQTVAKILSHLSEVKVTTSETVQSFTRVSTTVLQLYNESQHGHEEVVPDLLYSMENVLSATSINDTISIHSPEIDLFVETVDTNLTNGDVLSLSSYIGTVTLPVTIFDGRTSRVSVIIYKTVNQRWSVKKGYNNAKIGSNIMSVSVQQPHNDSIQKLEVNMTGAVIVMLPTNITRKEKTRICTYWSFKYSFWDTEGGKVLRMNDTHTECRYDHMTNFAVLVLYYDEIDPVTAEESHILYILTALGCSLSIACLLVTIMVYLYLKVLSNESVMIHANLSLALMLAQIVLVTSDGAAKYPTACKIVTILMHFLFLAAFTWMMVEGFALYLSCTRAMYNFGEMKTKYIAAGWGIPAVIVVVSLGAQFPNYGDGIGNSCWLSLDNGLIWSFMGPLILIVVSNIIILGLVLKIFLTLRANARKSEAARLRASLRAIITLLPILGITWFLGVLVPLSDVFHYLFVIGNSVQGMMIFFLHCICNNVVRKKFVEKRKKQSSSAWSGDISDLSDIRGPTAMVTIRRKSNPQKLSHLRRVYSVNPTEGSPYC